MTVTIHDKSFVVEAAAAKNPQNYIWYQVTKGKILLDSASKQFDVELKRGDKFGLKRTKTALFLIDEDDLTVQFKVSHDDFDALMKNSKGYSGPIAGVLVQSGNKEGAPSLHKDDITSMENLVYKAKGEIADGFNPIGKNPKLSGALSKYLKALNQIIFKYRKNNTALPPEIDRFAKKYGLGEVNQTDFTARLRNPKDGASIIPGPSRRSTKLIPADQKLVDKYKGEYYNLEKMLSVNLRYEIEGKSPAFSKTAINRQLRLTHSAASAALKEGVALPSSGLLDYYGFGTTSVKELLAKPDYVIEGTRNSTKNMRKNTIKNALSEMRTFSAHLAKKGSSSDARDMDRLKRALRTAEKAFLVLDHNNVTIPKNLMSAVDYVKTHSRKKGIKHPGLDVKQGSVPTPDKKASSKRAIGRRAP